MLASHHIYFALKQVIRMIWDILDKCEGRSGGGEEGVGSNSYSIQKPIDIRDKNLKFLSVAQGT